MKTADKLQKYAMRQVGQENTIWSKSTHSAYFNFQGTTVRISDHLPTGGSVNGSGASLSIIITSKPDQYILQQHSTGRLSVITYNQAKEIIRGVVYISDVFRYPQTPFRLEKEVIDAATPETTVLGEPLSGFTEGQQKMIRNLVTNARGRRIQKMAQERKTERKEEHLETPGK